MDIKEIAERVSKRIYVEDGLLLSKFISEKFAEALIAELAKQNEPVMVLFQHEDTGRTTSIEPQIASDFGRINKRWINCGPLFSFPPTAEQIANETAEAIAEYCRNQDYYCLATEIESGAWKEFKK